jgi:hypothetical protein
MMLILTPTTLAQISQHKSTSNSVLLDSIVLFDTPCVSNQPMFILYGKSICNALLLKGDLNELTDLLNPVERQQKLLN